MTICLKFEIEKLSVLFECSPRTDLYISLNSKQHIFYSKSTWISMIFNHAFYSE